jgi:hypothetical protein
MRKVGDQTMEKSIREFSGREFTPEEIELIQWTVKTYPTLKRRELANTLCEFLGWKQISGKPKTIQSMALLKALEEKGILQLPPQVKKSSEENKKKIRKATHKSYEKTVTVETENKATIKTAKAPIEVVPAETPEEKIHWRKYVKEYHKLGHKKAFGAQIRYFIRSGDEDLGCLEFSASAWSLSPRDQWIGWELQDRKSRLHLVVNNSRFLVLPWVQIKNMASQALSLAARRICQDWLRIYCYAPVLLETFVETDYYNGTCYKAANWIYLGQTQGRGRQDRYHERKLAEKSIYVYPLHQGFREILKGDKPYKVVEPNE